MRRLLLMMAGFLTVTACGGGSYPFDDSASDSSGLAQEYAEGRSEAELYDQYKEDQYDQYAAEASTEMAIDELEDYYFDNDAAPRPVVGESGCPSGCSFHPPGCDIKGNISIKTGEKIYHVPGQEYYSATQISPEYGERWFCTEAEAIANGWRKAEV